MSNSSLRFTAKDFVAVVESRHLGFLTGSRAFRCEKGDSDYDIVVRAMSSVSGFSVEEFLRKADISTSCYLGKPTPSPYFNGIKITLHTGEVVNFIPVSDQSIGAWSYATRMMYTAVQRISATHKTVSIHGLVTKQQRIAMFEMFRAQYSMLAADIHLKGVAAIAKHVEDPSVYRTV